jgi:clan AA aspartic protease (TIGR02281 family)
LVIVEATVCGREKCFMVVDTGATSVTISPSLVKVLGLSDQLGKNVNATLADGTQTTGREVVIPQLSVVGMEVRGVNAVVLDEPGVGIDGLLGLSYLNHFDFHLDQQHPSKLILKPKTEHE